MDSLLTRLEALPPLVDEDSDCGRALFRPNIVLSSSSELLIRSVSSYLAMASRLMTWVRLRSRLLVVVLRVTGPRPFYYAPCSLD